ncbi:hypothetical protein FC51_GL001718 [Lentilactobacillus parabuchneri DSM 5707 = NBRC 107865]|uniref:Uncharacterized protein n=1 Tax=Lentilactobacillus parabuchneri DSM 5707 = NBRC 107865 TaxID=1423784 RepID=A0A0R1YW06_9LACO|nr:hypothetical protein FC51_GL001718 [Lentilactobacillus parabuchneri DSM 5707 = NBRC 107865]KRN77988.1 hypothetical protein IV42_GL002283 [Lentilactobacillus parabuchneri]
MVLKITNNAIRKVSKTFKAENDEGSFIVSSFFVQPQATQTKLSKAIHASANIRI